jgi:hypothetical protein
MASLAKEPERRAPGQYARAGNRGKANLTHTVTESPHRPVRGAHTKTDRDPMSTPEYHGHMRRIS